MSITSVEAKKMIDGILNDPYVSNWLKDAVKTSLNRHCIDAYYDAKLLEQVLKLHMDSYLGR
jgi:hypothetical protein